jgi:hypothetical protein
MLSTVWTGSVHGVSQKAVGHLRMVSLQGGHGEDRSATEGVGGVQSADSPDSQPSQLWHHLGRGQRERIGADKPYLGGRLSPGAMPFQKPGPLPMSVHPFCPVPPGKATSPISVGRRQSRAKEETPICMH